MTLAFFFPPFHSWLGDVYSYDPNAFPWAGRIYGVFRSPIEGCVVLCLSFLLLLNTRWAKAPIRWGALLAIAIGILLSKTITAAIALFVALTFVFWHRIAQKVRIALMASTCGIILLLGLLMSHYPFFQEKKLNFLARARTWEIYCETLFSRLDLLVLGLGFQPHYTDSNYLFFISRGGVLLFLLGAIAFSKVLTKHWKQWTPLQRAIPVFFLLSGLTVDSLIIRPVAYVLVCAGVPVLLARNDRSSHS